MELIDLGGVTAETFRPLIGQGFRVAGSEVVITLESVNLLGTARNPELREPFSLIFQLPGPGKCLQTTYRLEHDTFGALDLFLVQTSPTGIEAVFN